MKRPLAIGEKIVIERPQVANLYLSLYKSAIKAGIRISIKSVDSEKMEIRRKK